MSNASTTLLDGRAVSRELLEECGSRTEHLSERYGVVPHLAVVLVGEDPASAIYVGAKERACKRSGLRSTVVRLDGGSTTDEVCQAVSTLADDGQIHGIIVQLPLPDGIDPEKVLAEIPPEKDADGFHLYNVGGLFLGRSVFPPCTPEGVMRLLDHASIDLEGANVVVVGASNIVGKPMAVMALRREATVTICHVKTRDLAEHTRKADVLICAAGYPGLITGDMVKDGVVVVDVGINRVEGGGVTGDIDFASVSPRASHISPVPGGVGPMTVSVLVTNTVRIAERSVGIPSRRPDAEDLAAL